MIYKSKGLTIIISKGHKVSVTKNKIAINIQILINDKFIVFEIDAVTNPKKHKYD